MQCAIYCRVSSQGQKDKNDIAKQLKDVPDYAESKGWDIYHTYIDDGISGKHIWTRPQFRKLLDDMEQKKFEILLVDLSDRIARTDSNTERGIIMDALMENDIKYATTTGGLVDHF